MYGPMTDIWDPNYKGDFCLLVNEKVGCVFSKSILHPLDREITRGGGGVWIWFIALPCFLLFIGFILLPGRRCPHEHDVKRSLSTEQLQAAVSIVSPPPFCFSTDTSPCNNWTRPAAHLLLSLSSELQMPTPGTLSSTTHPTYVSYTEPIYMTALQGPLPHNLETIPWSYTLVPPPSGLTQAQP